MSEIIIKAPPEKKGTGRDPIADYGDEHRQAMRLGAERAKTLTFENEGERRDYERVVRANPNNVYGMPKVCMFPELKLSFSLQDLPGEPAYSCECGFRAIFKAENCARCGRPVPESPWRLIAEESIFEDVARSLASQLRVIFNEHSRLGEQEPIRLVVSEAIYDQLRAWFDRAGKVGAVGKNVSFGGDCELLWDPTVPRNIVKVYAMRGPE